MNNPYSKLDSNVLMLAMYDDYIRYANEERSYEEGWRPVCLNEFHDMEYEDYLQNPEDYELDLDEGLIQLLLSLDSTELDRLSEAYDRYIQAANDSLGNKLDDGSWQPMTLRTFLMAEEENLF